jgi:hypothetical protein
MLLVLLLGIADFGRVFAAGITSEAAARNGAEAVALERLRLPPPTDPALQPAYYQTLHELGARTVCRELSKLPNTTFDPSTQTCSAPSEPNGGMPVVAVCVRDGIDPLCTAAAAVTDHAGAVPPECGQILNTPYDNTSGGELASHSVEVRVCYQFTTLFNLRFSLPVNTGLDLGDIWLQRAREFVVDCPPGDPSAC